MADLDSELNDLVDFEDEKKTKPAKERLRGLTAAVALFAQAVRDDETASLKRAKVDAMVDGANPYDQAKLVAMGQGGRCNVDWAIAQKRVDAALSGYVDLATSGEYLCDVRVRYDGEDLTTTEIESIINTEVTRTIRYHGQWMPRYLRLCTEFIKHGVAPTYFLDKYSWKPEVAGLRNFKLPRNCEACEEAIDVCHAFRDIPVHELWSIIENESIAESEGWVVEEVMKTIGRACRSNKDDKTTDYEAYQRLVKNSNTHASMEAKQCRIVHTWVKESDGYVSHYVWDRKHYEDNKKEIQSGKFNAVKGGWLYRHHREYERSEQCFTIFTNGVGNNGTYDSIRGYGHRIYNIVSYLTRLRCQMADQAQMSGGIMVQPNSMEDLRDLAIQTYGQYQVLRPNIDVVDKKVSPDLTRSVIPALQDLTNQLDESTDFFSTDRAAMGSPYRNKLQVQAELDQATRLSQASLALFYLSFDRLIREMVRRLLTGPKSDPSVSELHKRLAQRGILPVHLKAVDHSLTKAARAVGGGNPAARAATLEKLERNRGYYDPVGNRNLTYDLTAAEVGHEMAARYAPRTEEPRGTTEESLAAVEEGLLSLGRPVQVLSAQIHAVHLDVHIPPTQQLIAAISGQEIDPTQVMPELGARIQHLTAHAQAIAGDPTLQDLISIVADTVNKAQQILDNTQRAVEAQGPQEGGGADAETQAKQMKAEVEMQIMQAKADLEMSIKQAKAEQEQRLADFKAAATAAREAGQQP